ncbi:hypothetical protein GFY24_31010 [Nocardia sp. SYP-A9097]|uniref:hypothetical protein n=1 Tax=Nocardia sp. SYP-A9097 TaxID=2663237 RepID=UPI00129A323C|nr:hypothetical protein [Nocardia sp. SYP-A9097]MRH91817.1 hypothetical protein [Nocardia sp. SYP-A9097]
MTAREARTPVRMAECAGLWERTLLVDVDGSQDITTDVRWLQGITRFVDLRRPMPRPDFSGVRCAADLTDQQRAWMRMQDGFAGQLTQYSDVFHWRRGIELQPPGPHPDEGRMSYTGDLLVEIGVHADYFEHWARETPGQSCWAMELKDPAGAQALLVRVDDLFGWARRDTEGAVELSLGSVRGGDWIITDSALPYREQQGLVPRWVGDTRIHLHTNDIDAHGTPLIREWLVGYTEGNVTL